MIDPVVGYDSYDYNNGTPPAVGLVWYGESWGWPTYDTGNGGDTMVLWPSTDNSVSDTVKEAVNSDICLRCGQKNCPYIKDGKDYKDLRKALRNNDTKTARKIYIQRFAQFSKMSNAKLMEEIKKKKEERKKAELEALLKASEVIADVGNKLSEYLGEEYKSLASEISGNVKNFQGKTIRTHEQAMAALNSVMKNPYLKIKKDDRDALINAWKSLNANDMANKLGNLGKVFKGADVVMKIEKVRQKSIEGYETGNWEPLMLEVESWILGGIASGIALALFSASIGVPVALAGFPIVSAIMGILLVGAVGAMIDDKVAEKLNNIIKNKFS